MRGRLLRARSHEDKVEYYDYLVSQPLDKRHGSRPLIILGGRMGGGSNTWGIKKAKKFQGGGLAGFGRQSGQAAFGIRAAWLYRWELSRRLLVPDPEPSITAEVGRIGRRGDTRGGETK